jgi:hypothetical protein
MATMASQSSRSSQTNTMGFTVFLSMIANCSR